MFQRSTKKTLLIFGYGYVAGFLAKILDSKKWNIIGTSRSKKADERCNLIDYCNTFEIKKSILKATHILISVPPNNKGDIVFQRFKETIFTHSNVEWIGYCSSTNVYGNHNGLWVDEKTMIHPTTQKARNRVLAELQWLEFGANNRITTNIFRISSIYGPQRNSFLKIRKGKLFSIYKKGQFFSRIHVFDIANIIKIAMTKTLLGNEIFNLSDDCPCSTIEVNNYIAKLLNIPPPETLLYENCTISKTMKEFYQDNKRVSNRKIKKVLDIELEFPTYQEGLINEFKMISI